jgi:hypothetical protein
MFFLVCVSTAVRLLVEKELLDLLDKSRKTNQVLGITGMLLYKEGNFMQFLEGSREKVIALMEKTRKDPRHRGVITLLQQEHTEREFPEWAMGFKNVESDSLPQLPGYSDFLDLPLTSEQFLMNPSKSLRLLLNFKNILR